MGKFAAYGLLLLLAVCGACSELSGEDPLAVTRVSGPLAKVQLLPMVGRLRSTHTLLGKNDSVHLALVSPEPDPADEPVIGSVQVQSLQPPFLLSQVPERAVAFPPAPARGFCSATLGSDLDLPQLFLHRPDVPPDGPFTAIVQPADKLRLLCGNSTLLAYGSSRDNLGIDLLRRQPDGTVVHKVLPWPSNAEPAWGQGPLGFDYDERAVFLLGGDIVTRAYYLDGGASVDLGILYWGAPTKRGELFVDVDGMLLLYNVDTKRSTFLGVRVSPEGAVIGIDAEHEAVLTCDWDGVRRIPLRAPFALDSRNVQVLDRDPCQAVDWDGTAQPSVLYYVGDQLRQVATNGKSAPAVVTNYLGQQMFALCNDGALAYSLDPPERYGRGVGDGYIGGRRFMERGRDVRFSPDCRHVYFKENAATLRRLGQLRSFDRQNPGPDAILPLAENVGFTAVLADGRILLQDNLATIGDHNRITLIDPQALTARTLLTGPVAILSLTQLSRTIPTAAADQILLEVDTAEITGPRRIMMMQVPPR